MPSNDWLSALRETLLKYQEVPFIWGETDCCQFVNDYHEALTGERFDFDYLSEMQAKRLLVEHGGVQGLLTELLGEPGELKTGAIVALEESAGVFNGHYVFSVNEEHGLVRLSTHGVKAAWPQ